MAKPTFPPYVCINCGMQNERKWFVDLQLQLDNHFNPLMHGVVYLCNLCFDSMVQSTMEQAQRFEGDIYTAGEKPTYDNQDELLEEVPNGSNGRTVPDSGSAGIDFQPPGEPEANNDDQSESTDDIDGAPESLSHFRVHFGK